MIKLNTKVYVALIIGIFTSTGLMAVPYGTGYRVITFVDSSRGNRLIETLIYYPADISGFETDLAAPSDKKFPVVIMGHDQETGFNNYQYLWDGLVPKGFMVALPLSEAGPTMDVTEFAKDLAFVASSFVDMRYDNTSFFFKRYNSKSCVMGHGYGGSAATLAVQYNAAITALVSMAAFETAPGVIAAASQITIPSVVIGGAEDCVAPEAANQELIYNALASDCKTYVNLLYASHCNFAQGNGPCVANDILCYGNAVSYLSTNYSTNYLLVSFLRYYMKYNTPALPKFEWKLQHKTNQLTYIFDCGNINARFANDDVSEEALVSDVKIYPNPISSGNTLNVIIPSEEALDANIFINDMLGRIVYKNNVAIPESSNEISVATSGINKGYYMLTILSVDGKISKPLIVD